MVHFWNFFLYHYVFCVPNTLFLQAVLQVDFQYQGQIAREALHLLCMHSCSVSSYAMILSSHIVNRAIT